MNSFDQGIIHFVNVFSQHSRLFDTLVVFVSQNTLLKGGIMMALFWWAWERNDDARREHREFLVLGLFATLFAVIAARTLALTLPFRARPLDNPLLGFQLPISMNPGTLINWSAFPSDHAAIFFCLATVLWLVSKRLGALAFCYSVCVIALPRIYLGIHYPTDIIAGALLGICVAAVSTAAWLRRYAARPALSWLDGHPAQGYAFLFLFSFEIAELFDSLRHLTHGAVQAILAILQAHR